MKIDQNEKVGEIVKLDIRTAHVFKKHGIDFCCGGGISLDKVCERHEISLPKLISELEETTAEVNPEVPNYDEWSAAELCDYIEENHHSYVKESLPMLQAYAEKVASVHGHHHPELVEMLPKVNLLVSDLSHHLQKEEMVLFPWIRKFVEADGQVMPPFGKFDNPVRMMEEEHDLAGEIMHELRAMSNNYNLPEYACNTWRAYFHLLDEFEDDLHMHIHLENNVLHLKARAFDAMQHVN